MFLNLTSITKENAELHFSEAFSKVNGHDGNLELGFPLVEILSMSEPLHKLLSRFEYYEVQFCWIQGKDVIGKRCDMWLGAQSRMTGPTF